MRWSYGNIEVVAPSSAPILVMVALPVALIERAPGPKYSMMALVPPATVSSPASLRITSFGAVQPLISPVRYTPMKRGKSTSQGSPAMTSTASAPPTPTAQEPRPPAMGECVILQRHLVDDAGAWPPEAHPVLGCSGAQKVVHLIVFR